jgi:hypothetical protein
MKTTQILARFVAVGSVVWAAASCGVEQPLPQCTVGRGGHAVRYTLQSGSGPCASRRPEVIGAQSFRQFGENNEPRPSVLALKPTALANAQGEGPLATGNFTSPLPSEEAVCEVPTLSEVAGQVVPAGGGAPVQARYRWSGLRLHNTAAIPGTQWTGTLEYTEGSCTATFKAVGVFPAITCRDAQGRPDDKLCTQRQGGLALEPSFPVRCDAESFLCVLDGEPPALKPVTRP